MLTKTLSFSFVLVSALALTGCTDPIVGSWEATEKNACSERSDFDVDDDLLVKGDIWFEDAANQVCFKCKFDGEFDDPEDNKYQGEVDLEDACSCNGETNFDAECKMNDDETELDCEINLDECGTYQDDFEKQE
ncbi:MAG: hypothetical protein DRI90_15150 [Deltaproteobacteria bacterium]|nr:MAG: hypothetical protein DRI90_15150 [Deltaproteobacteria bacterium]